MGKSKGGGPKSPTTKSTGAGITPEVQGKVDALRTEGQAQFLKKEFGKAAEAYSQAAQLLPDCDTKAELLQKKVGCLINLKKYKEAVKDATSVLQLSPNSPGALKSRARAYEQLGLYKQALADAQAVNRTDAATADTRDLEKRIRDAMAGKSSRPSSAASQPSRNAPYVPPITVKLSLNGDTRLVHVDYTVSYAELLELTREKFPTAGPVMLKYQDKDGDAIVISSRQDVQVALSDLVKAFHRQLQGAHAPKLGQQALPALKLQVVPVASEAEVPRPPVMELAERANTTSQEVDAAAAAAGAAPAPQPYEGEEWLMDFVRVFNDVTGVDPAAHLEHHQLGGDKLQRGMMEAVHSEAAEELLDDAAAHFRDAVVTSYVQWGNVFLVKADRALHALQKACTADPSKQWEGSAELQAAMGFYDKAVDMIKKALEVNPDGWECWAALGQVEWERAKAKMGYVVPLPPASQEDPSKTPEQLQAEMQAANTKVVEQVLAGISKERVDAIKPHVDKCNETYDKAMELANKVWAAKKARDAERAKKEEAKKAAEAQKEGAGANGNTEAAAKAEEEKQEEADEKLPLSSPPSTVLISHGNIIYELSQVYAVTGAHEWRPLLDEAAVKFRASGAPEADVRNALKNHLRKDELDLGPDPEPEAATPTAAGSSSAPAAPSTPTSSAPAAPAASPAAAAPAAEAAKAKGLPSLEVKKGKK